MDAHARLADGVEFRILGPLEVADHGALLPLGGVKQRGLLAILLLNANEVVSADRVIDELWGESLPSSGRSALQVRISQLRKALGVAGGQLLTRPPGYQLALERDQLDLHRFEGLVTDADAADPATASAKLREALALWRGEPLADLCYETFALPAADRLQELRVATLEKRIQADLALGRHAELVAELEALVAEYPLRERLRGQLMLALYRSGRQADALDVYQRVRTRLCDDLGLEPGHELKGLQGAILKQDPGLEPPVSKGGGPVQPNPVVQVAEPRRARKVVTVMFCDAAGSTALGEELDPEALWNVISRYFAEMRAIIERHGGQVAKFIGDAVLAVFGVPHVREDDALRAVRAAAEIRQRLPAVAEETGVTLRFRTGLNTGLVLVEGGDTLVVGDAVNVAARLEQAARPGEILIGAPTMHLVRDAVALEPVVPLVLKGKAEPVAAFRLLSVDPVAPGIARCFDAPLVGRKRELRLLRDVRDRSIAESGCHLFTLLGVAGAGKSRLVAELLSEVGEEALVLRGRCLPYGQNITFWPLVEALSAVCDSALLERLSDGSGVSLSDVVAEVGRLLESLASKRPVLLHIDDLQWAEPILLDLLGHIVQASRSLPVLLLCAARPELLESHPDWGSGIVNSTTVLLESLGSDECNELLEQRGRDVDPGLRAKLVGISAGNPLFLEEMLTLARETGTAGVPPMVHALLAARLEHLTDNERDVLARASVEGEVFHRTTVQALSDQQPASELEAALTGLLRKGLIRAYRATGEGEDSLRFCQLLIRDAVYETLPRETRACLHEQLAWWLEDSDDAPMHRKAIAEWHLDQAIRYRRQLGQDIAAQLARDPA
jgi:class 3 adenylate cyclase/DNA-binding SARP family transcriptional activator